MTGVEEGNGVGLDVRVAGTCGIRVVVAVALGEAVAGD